MQGSKGQIHQSEKLLRRALVTGSLRTVQEGVICSAVRKRNTCRVCGRSACI